MSDASKYLQENFGLFLDDLKALVKIPSVSFPGFPASEVQKSGEAVAALLKNRGLENVKILTIPGAHPYVYGERMRAPGMPTLLLYAHHDVQPPGREELWRTPPFSPSEAEGPGGTRLYGRGAADDKAGIIVHTSAIASYLHAVGELPVNVKVIIEGEEEIGSEHLEQFLQAYQDEFKADVLVLTDTTNFDCGVPALTVSLRGLVEIGVEVKGLQNTVHSGMWGGPVPDPAMGLSKMLATLVDSQGKIAIPGVLDEIQPLTPQEEKELKKIPYDEKLFREQVGMLPGVELLNINQSKDSPLSALAQIWRLPSLTVNAVQASSRVQAGNVINDSVWAKVTIRLVANMNPEKTLERLKKHMRDNLPWGLKMEFDSESCSSAWSTDSSGEVFAAAERALERGYGNAPHKIGCGGSIPFVKPFAKALGGAPALLVGVEDPYTNAHGENESLLISDFKKACLSQIYLFQELADLWKSKRNS